MNPARLLATDYVLGLLADDTRRQVDVQRHADAALNAEIRHVETLLARGPISPNKQADGLFARVMGQVAKGWQANPWTPAWAGVEKRALWDEHSYLIRCTPGAVIPGHRHEREERILVLEGEIQVGERHLSAGAYEVSPKGSVHENARAETDCLILTQVSG